MSRYIYLCNIAPETSESKQQKNEETSEGAAKIDVIDDDSEKGIYIYILIFKCRIRVHAGQLIHGDEILRAWRASREQHDPRRQQIPPPLVSKISKIGGWYNTIGNDYCLGLQATYDKNQTPPEFIGQLAKGETMVEFSLAEDEYVMGIYGRGGEIINTLTFVTSSGRELKIGSSEREGNPFKIELPGHRIHTLVYGVGDYLTLVGAYFVPHSTSPKLFGGDIEDKVDRKQELMIESFPWVIYEEHGNYHKDTVVVDHLKGICEGGGRLHKKITHIRAFENTQDYQRPLGFEIFYDNHSGGAYFGENISNSRCKNLVLGDNEYLMEIKGRFKTVMEYLVFITSLGREFNVGGSSMFGRGTIFSIKQGD